MPHVRHPGSRQQGGYCWWRPEPRRLGGQKRSRLSHSGPSTKHEHFSNIPFRARAQQCRPQGPPRRLPLQERRTLLRRLQPLQHHRKCRRESKHSRRSRRRGTVHGPRPRRRFSRITPCCWSCGASTEPSRDCRQAFPRGHLACRRSCRPRRHPRRLPRFSAAGRKRSFEARLQRRGLPRLRHSRQGRSQLQRLGRRPHLGGGPRRAPHRRSHSINSNSRRVDQSILRQTRSRRRTTPGDRGQPVVPSGRLLHRPGRWCWPEDLQ